MQVVEPVAQAWKAHLSLRFERERARTVLAENLSHGPLVVQKPLYPEGEGVCHAIVVHPPAGIVGGDELKLSVQSAKESCALLTTPGAAKWYRSAGAWARQTIELDVAGSLEWLPRETIVFDGALAELRTEIGLKSEARFIGWEIVCLGRSGFGKGKLKIETSIRRGKELLWFERALLDAGSALTRSPAGLAGHSVFGTLVAAPAPVEVLGDCRKIVATSVLPGLMIARYLGDSTEEAFHMLRRVWAILRPALLGRDAVAPRIWST
jgi:urease accessory protein